MTVRATELDELVQDLRAHAHEAPAQCCALMRRAATELAARRVTSLADVAARLAVDGPRTSDTARVPAPRAAKEKVSCD